MFAQENETILHASPLKVWSALTRFEDYGRWSPFIRIAGPLELGAIVQYSFRMNANKPRFFNIDARITALELHRHIAYRFSLGWLISMEESYSVALDPVGSRVIHSFRCTGPLSALNIPKMNRNLKQILETTDRLFQRHLRPVRPSGPAKKRARKGLRPNA